MQKLIITKLNSDTKQHYLKHSVETLARFSKLMLVSENKTYHVGHTPVHDQFNDTKLNLRIVPVWHQRCYSHGIR